MRQLYFDTCAFSEHALRLACAVVGPERLLFGTDYPYIDADAGHVERLALGQAEQGAVLGGNAARLFGIAGGAALLWESARGENRP